MSADYLNRVLIYLKQELPEAYQQHIKLVDDKFVIVVPDGTDFQKFYDILHPEIISSLKRVRSLDVDLAFTVWSKFQERDFKILKQGINN